MKLCQNVRHYKILARIKNGSCQVKKLSNSSEHDKPMWELVLPHLELTVTMREKKSIRKYFLNREVIV